MRSLALMGLRSRWPAMAGLFIAVLAAAALVTSFATIIEFGVRGGVPPERLAGADLVVLAPQSVVETHDDGDVPEEDMVDLTELVRLDASLIDAIADVPGVASAIADLSFRAHVIDHDGQPIAGPGDGSSLGHSWESIAATPFILVSGRPPETSGEVVLDDALATAASLTVGDPTELVAAGVSHSAVVVGIVSPQTGPLEHQAALFFDSDTAREMYGFPVEVDGVAVVLADGADAARVAGDIRMRAGSAVEILTGLERGRAEFPKTRPANGQMIALGGVVAANSVFAAVLVISIMFGLIVQQRQREIALLRSIGATKRQVRRMIRFEMLLLSIVASVMGVWLGKTVAAGLLNLMKTAGAVPDSFQTEAGPVPGVVAFVLITAASWTAGVVAGRRATAVGPVESLREAALPNRAIGTRRMLLGLVALAAATGLWFLSVSGAGSVQALAIPFYMVLLSIAALFAPPLAQGTLRLVSWLTRGSPVGGYLAVANMKALSRRLALAVLPVVFVITIAASGLFQQSTISAEANEQSAERITADAVVLAGPAGLPDEAVSDLEASAGVATAVGIHETSVLAGAYLVDYPALGVTPGSIDQVLDLDFRPGSKTELSSGDVFLSSDLANDLGAAIGDQVSLRLGDGTPIDQQVSGVFSRSFQGFAHAILLDDVIQDHVSDRSLSRILINLESGGSAPDWDAFTALHPGVVVGDSSLAVEEDAAASSIRAGVSYTIFGMLAAFAVIALINILVVMTSGRRREFAQMRLLGATRSQVVQILVWECLIVTLIAGIVGGVLTTVHLAPLSQVMRGSWLPDISWAHAAGVVAVALALTLAATLVPARRSLRIPPIELMRRSD